MKTTGSLRNRTGCIVQALKFLFVPVLAYLFRYEILLVINLFRVLILDEKTVSLPPTQVWSLQIIFFAGGLVVAAAAAFLLLYVIAGSIFPLADLGDRYEMMRRMAAFLVGWHAPVIWAREGRVQLDARHADKGHAGGVVLVDPTSAVVLEDTKKKANEPPEPDDPGREDDAAKKKVRVCGSGVYFMRRKEKLLGAVSLRTQTRSLSDVKVQTSDGIELNTSVNVKFTLGEAPKVLKVAYVTDPYAVNGGKTNGGLLAPGSFAVSLKDQDYLNLRVLKIERVKRAGGGEDWGNVKEILPESTLDVEDRKAIHEFAREFLRKPVNLQKALAPDDDSRKYPPYLVDEKRIRAAVRAAARWAGEDGVDQWSDFPTRVALARLRNLMATYKYDDLYLPTGFDVFKSVSQNPGSSPLSERIKPDFGRAIEYQGVISFQLIFPPPGQMITERMLINPAMFRIAPPQPIRPNGKILRELGIKVASAGFGDLTPSPEIQQQRLEQWVVRWKEVTEHQKAVRLAYADRIKNKAKARRYFEMIDNMNKILNDPSLSGDLLLSMIIQTLREIANDQDTRKGLPDETVLLLQSFQTRLTPPPAKKP